MIDNHCIFCVIYGTEYECKECYKREKKKERKNLFVQDV